MALPDQWHFPAWGRRERAGQRPKAEPGAGSAGRGAARRRLDNAPHPADSGNARRPESAECEMQALLSGAQRLDELLLVHS
jgi:hypothetical protein